MIWYGSVFEVSGDSFWAAMSRDGDAFERVEAQFSMSECKVEVEEGDIVRLDSEENQMSRVPPRIWTQEELDKIKQRATEQWEQMQGLFS